MTTALQFKDEGERRAWDVCVASLLNCDHVGMGEALRAADLFVLGRRERSVDLEPKGASGPFARDYPPGSFASEHMSDAVFLDSCEEHCKTKLALFHIDQVQRAMKLAGHEPLWNGDGTRQWLTVRENSIGPIVKAARERLRP